MLEPILKGLVEWLYEMMLDIMAYASGELLGVMRMDLSYFEKTAPVISEIVNVFVALGWALLIGNMVFQLMKSIMSGIGFEAEDPKIIFLRTFVFAFLLLASRQICDICSGIAGTVINMLALPSSITVTTPDESMFSLGTGAKWLLVIIVGVVLMFQMLKLLFEICERYVITSVLTFFAPLAFAMGGSRNTNDIFKGWCRMYGSMLVMMIMNIVFLKLIMSAMSQMTSGGVLIWLVFVVALTRVARKIDSHIGKIGLNPAQTGAGIGSRIPGMMTMVAVRTMGSLVSRSMASAKGSAGAQGGAGKNGREKSGAAGGANPSKPAATRPPISRNTERNGTGGNTPTGGTTQNTENTYANPQSVNRSTQTGAVQQGGRSNPAGNAGAGGTTENVVSRQGRMKGNVNPVHSTNAPKPGANRPPIPRSTERTGEYSAERGSIAAGGNAEAVGRDGRNAPDRSRTGRDTHLHKTPGSPAAVPPKIPTNGGIRTEPGGQEVSVSRNEQRNTQNRSGIRSNGQSFGGGVRNTTIGGKTDGVNINQAEQSRFESAQSEHFGTERFSRETTEREREKRTDTKAYYNAEHRNTAETERKVNHEYKHGRYNPAAANRKAKKQYYRKESLQERRLNDRKGKRGENDRKRKW